MASIEKTVEKTNKKRGLLFYLSIYRKILVQDLKSKMSYRADFIISTFGMIMTNLSGFVTFMILFHNFPSINGWDYHHMLFLYGFSLIALTPVQCFFDNNWNLRFMVRSGDFIKYCFRPINVFFYFISEVFDVKGNRPVYFWYGYIYLCLGKDRNSYKCYNYPSGSTFSYYCIALYDCNNECGGSDLLLDY